MADTFVWFVACFAACFAFILFNICSFEKLDY